MAMTMPDLLCGVTVVCLECGGSAVSSDSGELAVRSDSGVLAVWSDYVRSAVWNDCGVLAVRSDVLCVPLTSSSTRLLSSNRSARSSSDVMRCICVRGATKRTTATMTQKVQ